MKQIVVSLSQLDFAPINLGARPIPRPEDKGYAEMKKNWIESIRTQGLLNLFSVAIRGDKYLTMDGNTRLYFIKLAIEEGDEVITKMFAEGIPVQVLEKTDAEFLAAGISANATRKDMKPAQYAQSLYKLLAMGEYTLASLQQLTSLSEGTINKYLGLLHLPTEVQELVNARAITINNASEFNKLPIDLQNDPEWMTKAQTLDGSAFAAAVAQQLKLEADIRKADKGNRNPEFSPVASMVKKERLALMYETAKQMFDRDPSDYNRIRKEVFDEIFQMDEVSVQNARAEWEKAKSEAEGKKEARKVKATAQKNLEAFVSAARLGVTIEVAKVQEELAKAELKKDDKLLATVKEQFKI